MWLNIKSGYSFKQVYGHLDKIAEKCKALCIESDIIEPYGGIADLGNTFAHVPWKKACKKVGIKPIYGVQLPVVESLQRNERRYPFNWMTFIAKNTEGLQEIYRLVDLSFQQFYYKQRITYEQINTTSLDVVIFSGIAPRWDLIKTEIFYELSPCTPYNKRKQLHSLPIACIDNYYIDLNDNMIYEPFADDKARLRERKTSPIHVLSRREWDNIYNNEDALFNLDIISANCNATIPNAPMVKYNGKEEIQDLCWKNAFKKGVDLNQPPYEKRWEREITLIIEKEYVDYFLVVADAVRYAKTKMTVGPARGSSAGSLVCYLLGITEIDPLEYNLFFERFIDINRFDFPDIDIDFQDNKRHLVIKYLENKYGKDNVAQIANINKMKPRSAINKFSDALGIPLDDVHELKDGMIQDLNSKTCIQDTFNNTNIGKKFIEEYPQMEVVKYIEDHPSHMGVHAAGILVCNKPITNYCGINSRDKKQIAMIDKRDAESVNLLKIDALGLRTLTIFAEICDQINKPYDWLYDIPIDDSKTYNIFNDHQYNGVFQFEGNMVQKLAKQIYFKNIEDIAAIGAIGRPGPLEAGSAYKYVQYKAGNKLIEYMNDHPIFIDITKNTFGVIIYQEQVMRIVKEIGNLSWSDTSKIRKAIAKSKGTKTFKNLYEKFEKGAIENKLTKDQTLNLWEHINTMGGYAFNKSHAVSYAIISYLCAYLKAHYPLEFTVACLNNSNNDRSAVKILRDAIKIDGINYKYFHPKHSEVKWSVKDKILYGGFISLDGVGLTTAKRAVKKRACDEPFTNKKIKECQSPFKYLYPGDEIYGDYYTDPKTHNLSGQVTKIKNLLLDGTFTVIGCLIKKKIKDANEPELVAKRKGKFLTGQTTWINLIIEDDTGQILCKIKKENYLKLGKNIAETGKEEKDWYMIYGDRVNGWDMLFVKNIKKITRRI